MWIGVTGGKCTPSHSIIAEVQHHCQNQGTPLKFLTTVAVDTFHQYTEFLGGRRTHPPPMISLHSKLTWLSHVQYCQLYPIVQRQPLPPKHLIALLGGLEVILVPIIPEPVLPANSPCPGVPSKEPVWISFFQRLSTTSR